MIDIRNEKGWPCVDYLRKTYPDGSTRERFVYLNPADETVAEVEIFDVLPVKMNQVNIRFSL